MTGYGRGEYAENGLRATAEIRSINSRFLEISVKLPRPFQARELEARELVRKGLQRGKISVTVQLERSDEMLPMRLRPEAVKTYLSLLQTLRELTGLQDPITLDHLLRFADMFELVEDISEESEHEWQVMCKAIEQAVQSVKEMRRKEGAELQRDFEQRIAAIERTLSYIEQLSQQTIQETREKLRAKVREVLTDESKVSRERLELEIVLLADKLDITEECIRFRSHNKFFLETLRQSDAPGRRLNFLLQEQNREANTIAAKSQNADISQAVVFLKEELEKIREQVQNIE
ncbi:MAG: YicC/YloC family endoribonuclease [Chloroherpetonaceae bacterium]|nr:YicC family protein [Chloroherpetonaceae bacterium]MCS7212450.1 YicC family protein [Chloroherpetonaceae bacterium]MDW8020685.1 YicC/YloC family endoribonuclease [Chloroherpetonaceae bacterium]MDW8465515.1 YicC/YloC family endoribonuclease [Chloroherpetonaceae bacterium]